LREILLIISIYALFVGCTTVLTGMQASLWLHIFGFFPAPYLWVPILNYWTLYRTPIEAIIMNYLVTFSLVTMSGVPLGVAFAVNFSIFLVVFSLKDRVLWSGPNSFMLANGIAGLVLPVATFLWSQLLEVRPLSDFYFYEWLIRALLTALFALPLYSLFTFFDNLTHKEAPKNTESEVL
jgi:hypothetical protein